MKQPIRFILALTTALSIVSTHASAFQSTTSLSRISSILPKEISKAPLLSMVKLHRAPVLRLRGGASDTDAKIAAAPPKKIRIGAFDSMRFFLILNIILGHFGRFANPSEKLLTAFSQHNVMVGAFFALSGYVTVRTTTSLTITILLMQFYGLDSSSASHLIATRLHVIRPTQQRNLANVSPLPNFLTHRNKHGFCKRSLASIPFIWPSFSCSHLCLSMQMRHTTAQSLRPHTPSFPSP